jgi:hypothetical protein
MVGGFRLAATPVNRILKGARPKDLPTEQPTTCELVISLESAKSAGALGATAHPSRVTRLWTNRAEYAHSRYWYTFAVRGWAERFRSAQILT